MATSIHFRRLLGKLRQHPVPLVAMVIIFLSLAGILIRSGTHEATAEELRQTEQEWDRINNNLKRSRDLAKHLAELETAHANVADRLIDPAERAINDDYFYGLEEESGVRLAALNQGGVIDTTDGKIAGVSPFKQYQLIGYSVSVEGTFEDIVTFLAALDNGRHFSRVSGFSVARAQGNEAGRLIVNLQLQMLGDPPQS
ncbi:MAG: hypothetical protein ACLFR7_01695 [Opitutales bacterium]